MTSHTSYELRSKVLIILLDGIRTQDLVGLVGHLVFHAFTVALLEFTLKVVSLINIYLSL
jgi:hypothetical protein